MKNIILIFALLLINHEAFAFDFTILSWNVESDKDTDPKLISKQLSEYQDIDFFALSEVDRKHSWKYFQAINSNKQFDYIVSNSGTSDKLQIIYNQKRFELLELRELMNMTFGNPHLRGALIGLFEHRKTKNKFYVMLNHLYRSNAEKRHEQSDILYEWVSQQDLPIIAVGDYNYDWDINDGKSKHDKGFDILTQNNLLRWLQPKELVPTHCDKQYNTILDFVFINRIEKTWQAKSKILQQTESFCINEKQGGSDHRPIFSSFTVSH